MHVCFILVYRSCSYSNVFAYIHNDDAPDIPELSEIGSMLHSSVDHLQSSATSAEINTLDGSWQMQADILSKAQLGLSHSLGSHSFGVPASCRFKNVLTDANFNHCSELPADNCARQRGIDIEKQLGRPDFRLDPGSFKVILCVDNQEYYGRFVVRFLLIVLFVHVSCRSKII